VNQTFNSTKGTGRRKSAVATVELVRGTGKFTINTIPGIDYMQQKADLLCYSSPIRFISAKKSI
jgi:ribosomal protein S9